ncbi:MAG TPA: ATP-binding protein [Bryobacteraceae bacterium]|nr:ATP-binding protein [Bryobacteraceae bacterium]
MSTVETQTIHAERANVTKSDFLARISHEMRTPVNGILGFAEMALKTNLTPVQREYLDRVLTSAEWLVHVLSDVLDFSRMESSSLELERREFSPVDCLLSAIKLIEPLASRKSLDLACRIDPDLPDVVSGDAVRLRQIIVNLLDNAVRFTTSGGIVLNASAIGPVGDHLILGVKVADTGIGIPYDQQAVIFEPFRDSTTTVSERTGSTGLGLSICKRLVEMMGGKIEVQSHVGAGTTFQFTVKLETIARHYPRVADVEVLSKLSFRRLSILVVDEDGANRSSATRFLESAGHHVSSLSNAAAGLEVFCADIFDLILVSAQLPDMDTGTFVRNVREFECEGMRTPIYLMTSSSDSAAAGIERRIAKPVRAEELAKMLSQISATTAALATAN